ncbi:inositol polyphosphate 5-phosphatase [Chytriomyces hyalinus]|nr:inositol polyphosphate 5-phosphatase [Chytriomyces hyalinus]
MHKSHKSLKQISPDSATRRSAASLLRGSERESICTRDWSQTHVDCFRVLVGTWNMNGTVPRSKVFPFADILTSEPEPSPSFSSSSSTIHRTNHSKSNMIAIGCQEARYTRAFKSWLDECLKLYESEGYALVHVVHMGSLTMVLLASWWMIPDISLQSGFATKNIFNRVFGNKGAVYASVRYKHLSILFVNCHFSAHQERVAERRNDYKKLSTKINMRFPLNDTTKQQCLRDGEDDLKQKFDHIFWFGDLNYRINGTRSMVDLLLKRNDQEVMLSNDQLIAEMKREHVLSGFQESEILFPPSYKFDTYKQKQASSSRWSCRRVAPCPTDFQFGCGANVYDTSNKCRIPSWTDRILYCTRGLSEDDSQTGGGIECESYLCALDVMDSDHKPVFGQYIVPLKTEGRNKKEK